MISFNRFVLDNGLRVLHHYDPDSTTTVLNTLYNVGARDEDENHTGFAHLFEHLMFGGSINVPSYDQAVENAGGSNNAFTNNDYTNYYISVPTENVETAFWLESDRMLMLDFSENSLEIQRGVVIEEFKQRCFNAPFGQLWHHIRWLLYKKHPYRWPTIGLDIKHIEAATLQDVEAFYMKHYHPANAILSVAGNIDLNKTKELCEKWYASITRTGQINKNEYPAEEPVSQIRELREVDLGPNNAVFLAWRGPEYNSDQSIHLEMFAEMLGGSDTSPLHLELVKKSGLFNAAESFYMRSLDDGIFLIYGLLNEGVTHETAKRMLMEQLHAALKPEFFSKRHIESTLNKVKAHLLFDNISTMNRAQKLCFFELTGNPNLINSELEVYENSSREFIELSARTTLNLENVSILYYSPKND